jgi:telomerase reverse transcriptase
MTGTILKLMDAAYGLLTSSSRRKRFPGYKCVVKKHQVEWLALHAFRQVLRRKQTGYREVIAWMDRELMKLNVKKGAQCCI